MLDNSPAGRALITACSLLDEMQSELKDVLSFTEDQRTQWQSKNEVRLALLLQFAERAQLHQVSYERIKKNVCMLHKPLTGAVQISTHDIERISSLFSDIDNDGLCCWMI